MDAKGKREVDELVEEVEDILLYLRTTHGDEATQSFIDRLIGRYRSEVALPTRAPDELPNLHR
jgi:hypothetical protein